MDGEIKSLIKVWLSVLVSLCYCYFIVSKIPKGKIRFFSLLPIFYLFSVLPLLLSSVHFTGIVAFFLTWLGNSKLLLFSFDQGPLSSNSPISFPRFVAIACLPIKIKQDPLSQSPPNIRNKENPSPQNTQSSFNSSLNSENKKNPSPQISKINPKSPLSLAVKVLLFTLLLRIYDYRQHLHPNIILILYCGHLFLLLEIVLTLGAAPARALLGLEIELQSNNPYLATSLQDFWGRRWNLMVTSILRPTVYHPVQRISEVICGRKWAQLLGILATFLVSGLMHELIYFYVVRVPPTWEVTWFFVVHGICTAMEVIVKKSLVGRWQLYRVASGLLTMGFLIVTAFWLFFPQILRNGVDARAIGEYSILVEFIKEKLR